MASQNFLTPPKRAFFRKSRPLDFKYDSTNIISSKYDRYQQTRPSVRAGGKMIIHPARERMFSDNVTDKRIKACIRMPEGILPQLSSGDYDFKNEIKKSTGEARLPNCLGAGDDNYINAILQDASLSHGGDFVPNPAGSDRALCVIKYEGQNQSRYWLHKEHFNYHALSSEEQRRLDEHGKRLMNQKRAQAKSSKKQKFDSVLSQNAKSKGQTNVSVQTDFRESEAQTDPYSPPYNLPEPDSYPKILALASLSWGKGLPINIDDIVVVERALTKRILESEDTRNQDRSDLTERLKVLEDLETQQWVEREKELGKLVDKKMQLIRKIIVDYGINMTNEHTTRLETLQHNLKEENIKFLKEIKHRYFRDLRKLERKYVPEKKLNRKTDIIDDYIYPGSKVYCPLLRDGPNPEAVAKIPNYNYTLHRDLDLFSKAVDSPEFRKKEVEFNVEKFKKTIKKTSLLPSDIKLRKSMEDIYESLTAHKKKDLGLFQQLTLHTKKPEQKTKANALDQTLKTEVSDEELRMPHLVLLQKQARGRVVHDYIRGEIEKNIREMADLKTRFDMDPNCSQVEEEVWRKLIERRIQDNSKDHEDLESKEVIEHLEGETLSRMLGFLEKEMVRLLDERKVHALILIADRERLRKEAMEDGRRSQEEDRRRKHDEVFRNVLEIHQSTVDIYLEDIFLGSCERAAEDGAREYVRELAAIYNEAASTGKKFQDMDTVEKEEMSAEIVSAFIIPELHRCSHRNDLSVAKERYKKVSQQVINAILSSNLALKDICADVPCENEGYREKSITTVEAEVEGVRQTVEDLTAELFNKDFDINALLNIDVEPDKARSSEGNVSIEEDFVLSDTELNMEEPEEACYFKEEPEEVIEDDEDNEVEVVEEPPSVRPRIPRIFEGPEQFMDEVFKKILPHTSSTSDSDEFTKE